MQIFRYSHTSVFLTENNIYKVDPSLRVTGKTNLTKARKKNYDF